ncbi:hypothetical protein BH10ACT1_BH10ACT1_19660 [soil metagenome]
MAGEGVGQGGVGPPVGSAAVTTGPPDGLALKGPTPRADGYGVSRPIAFASARSAATRVVAVR